ncbi:hypothetical protein AAVH_35394, partial [Aphelenchoides avenae]
MEHCASETFIARVHRTFDLSFHGSGIVLNMMLLRLILKNSPQHMGPYKKIMLMTCFNDFFMTFFCSLCGAVVLVDNGTWVMFSNGFFSGRSRTLDFILLLLASTVFVINSLCLPLQYFYRYLAVMG